MRRRAQRSSNEDILAKVNETLGSGFNLRLARALRARMALFVEGHDMKVLRNLARTVGAERLAIEDGVAIIELKGFSNWHYVEPFSWLSRELLGESVYTFILLDRDYRTPETVNDLLAKLKASGVDVHIWGRKELESYLLVPSALARLSGSSEDEVVSLMQEAFEDQRISVMSRFSAERQGFGKGSGKSGVTLIEEANREFHLGWKDWDFRLSSVNPKDVLHFLNAKFSHAGRRPVSFRVLSYRMQEGEIPMEMRLLLRDIEQRLVER